MERIDIEELKKHIKNIGLNKEILINFSGMVNAKLEMKNANLKFENEKIIIENKDQDIVIEKRFIKNTFAEKNFKKIEIELDSYQTITMLLEEN